VSLVLDASITLNWYFEDERTPATKAILDRVIEGSAVVPSLWRLEVANGFRSAMRRARIDAQFRDRALTQLSRLQITVDPETDARAWTGTLRFADRFGLTLYDAAYLDLAHREHLPLASLDQPLRAAARTLGLELRGVAE
jgi:predicted nucleic acid-binding protein